jgi:hypothetical protein
MSRALSTSQFGQLQKSAEAKGVTVNDMNGPYHAQFAEQLPMFMTAKEVRAKVALWGPDRANVNDRGETQWDHYAKKVAKARKDGEPIPTFGSIADTYGPSHLETDEEMLKRKYQESSRRSGTERTRDSKYTLVNEIKKNGPVEAPLHLSPAQFQLSGPRRDGDAPEVYEGKGNLVGGHHRLSVMLRHRPDELMPVMWHGSMGEARQSGHYS